MVEMTWDDFFPALDETSAAEDWYDRYFAGTFYPWNAGVGFYQP
jgi:hypothetical protein